MIRSSVACRATAALRGFFLSASVHNTASRTMQVPEKGDDLRETVMKLRSPGYRIQRAAAVCLPEPVREASGQVADSERLLKMPLGSIVYPAPESVRC